MGFAEGVVWSLLGAVAHTVIDVLRKFGAQKLPPADLIALLTIYNAAFAVLGVWLIDGGLPDLADMPDLTLFFKAVVATACTGLIAAVLYQRALSIAPLSLTVPYLAFAPVFVVFVSPMFLVGEVPSAMGLCGVAVVSIAGYKLGLLGAADAAAVSPQAGKAAKGKVPLLPLGSQAVNGSSTAYGRLSQPGGQPDEQQHLIPAAAAQGQDEAVVHGQHQQQSRVYQRQPAQLDAEPHGLEPHGACGTQYEPGQLQQAGQHGQQQQHSQHSQEPLLQPITPANMRSSSAGGSKQRSAWAIAYYKQKSPPGGVWEAACGGLQSAAHQLLATAGVSPRSAAALSSSRNIFGAGRANGLPSSLSGPVLSGADSIGSSSGGSAQVWVDSQAKASKDAGLPSLSNPDSKRGPHGSSGTAAQRSRPPRRWLGRLQGPVRRLEQAVRGTAKLLSGPSAGPTLVLIVAFLYSLTASMDKLGMSASSSTAFYLMMQRLLIAAVSMVYLLLMSPHTLKYLARDAVLLVSMSIVEQAAIVLYFKAIQNILVSYMVAIKRINVLLSTLVGCVMFKERIGHRMPWILLMLVGMLLIVLQPGHEALHHSHHTRH